MTGSTSSEQTSAHIYFDEIMAENDERKKIDLCKRAGDGALFEVGIKPTASERTLRRFIWTGKMGYNYLATASGVPGHMRRIYGELYAANDFYVCMMRQIGNVLIGRPDKQIIKKLHDNALGASIGGNGEVDEEAVRNTLKYEEILRKSGQDK